MTEIDVAKLLSLAENATPGWWEWRRSDLPGRRELFSRTGAVLRTGALGYGRVEDETFIAAVDPATVLALLERLEQAEMTIERVRALHYPLPNSASAMYPKPLCACSSGGHDECPTVAALDTGKEKNE